MPATGLDHIGTIGDGDMQGIIDLADRIERGLIELADEVHPGENDGHLRMLSPPSRRLSRCEAVLRSSLQLLEFAQDPLPKS